MIGEKKHPAKPYGFVGTPIIKPRAVCTGFTLFLSASENKFAEENYIHYHEKGEKQNEGKYGLLRCESRKKHKGEAEYYGGEILVYEVIRGGRNKITVDLAKEDDTR